jgi:NAD(P)H-hydrate epimerase
MDYLPEALYSAAATREADRRAIAGGLSGGTLMRRAGEAAFRLLRERFPRARRIAVVCGPGNNGGDGYVVARLARNAGLDVEVSSLAEPAGLHGEAAVACAAWRAAGGEVAAFAPGRLADVDLIVDALFGTGLERPVTGDWRTAIEAVNSAHAPVLALDIPSGLHADTGRVLGVAVHAAVTVSFIGLKAGLFTAEGREHGGLICFHGLGVPAQVYSGLAPQARRITEAGLRGLLAPRARHAHKGEAGRVLVIGGAPGMPGAARLAGEAAYRAGSGLVTLATHPGHAAALSAARAELIAYDINDPAVLEPLLARATAAAIGPGLGQGEWGASLWRAARASAVPLVVDADALRWLAREPAVRTDWVLTPHPGEAAALLGVSVEAVQDDRFAAVRALQQRYGGVCVLKGSGTLIAAPGEDSPWLCDRGSPALACGGTGDVLTGTIAALLAQGLAPRDAARLGAWVHAVAGERAAVGGERGVLASDLLVPLRDLINGLVTDAAYLARA